MAAELSARAPAQTRPRACEMGLPARRAWTAAALLALGCAAAGLALEWSGLGPLSRHMSWHIVLMNVAGPCAAMTALPWLAGRSAADGLARTLAPATVFHIALLWAWHAPPALGAMHDSSVVRALAGASLFGAALWFWLAVLAQGGAGRWRAILALLVTGKLFCLLGALMVFAPRAVYPHLAARPGALDDQHLAGLLMLAACPLTYVLAGVVSAARWLTDLSGGEEPAGPRDP